MKKVQFVLNHVRNFCFQTILFEFLLLFGNGCVNDNKEAGAFKKKRDKIFNVATLAQHGSLGFGWAKYWGKPTSLISPLNRNWGIAGKKVTALLAIETTELEMTIPGLADGSKIHIVVWDNKNNKKSEETITYKAPYKQMLKEYDIILIDKIN